MATTKNIIMKQFNGTDYDTLYPKTIAEQVDGIYNKDEVVSNSTKALYGLPDTAVPDNVFSLLNTLVNAAQERANISPKFEIGSYQGAYQSGNSCSKTIYFSGKPEIVIIVANGTRGLFPTSSGWYSREGVIVCRGQTEFVSSTNESGNVNVSFSDKSITLGPAEAMSVLNYDQYTYTYFALCT